ncbi:hypothetical protein JVX93_16060 [Mycolicibacterium boenickei]|nr:hypothetical protein JVX93_16060 [Mycolicibacterium boenickei]
MLRSMTVYASDGTEITAPAEPAAVVEPDPVVPDPVEVEPESVPADGEVVDAEVVTDIAVVDADDDHDDETKPWVHDGAWAHDWLDYKGDKLAIRVPQQNALTALYQAAQTCSQEFVMKLTSKFVQRHLSEASIERVLERMSDPDDEQFGSDDGVWNDLLKTIAEIGGKRAVKNAEALAAVQNGKGK